MQLLERGDTGEFRLTGYLPNDAIPEIPPYAILSHIWGDEEVLFNDLADGTAKNKAGYAKIQLCGDQAWRDGGSTIWELQSRIQVLKPQSGYHVTGATIWDPAGTTGEFPEPPIVMVH